MCVLFVIVVLLILFMMEVLFVATENILTI